MIKSNDKQELIKRIQGYLHFIRDRTHSELPMISIDGIYGNETRMAVAAFQEIYGLPKTGIVDRKTNDLIYAVYAESEEEKIESALFDKDFPISYGAYGIRVGIIHYLLDELKKYYKDLPEHNTGAFYGEKTEDAISALQLIFGYKPSSYVDVNLYNRIVRELKSFN